MKTIATVTAVNGNIATVEAERNSACEGCHKSEEGGCSVCTLMGGSGRKMTAGAYNDIGAAPGDRVMIESSTGRMMWYAALVFLLPVLLAIAAAVLASRLFENDVWQLVFAAGAFVLTFAGLMIYSRILSRRRCDIRITEIIKKADDLQI